MKLNLIVTKENSGAELQHRYHDIGFETDPGEENSVVNLYTDILFEEFEGFGGALTDSAAYIYSLPQCQVVNSKFDIKMFEANFLTNKLICPII